MPQAIYNHPAKIRMRHYQLSTPYYQLHFIPLAGLRAKNKKSTDRLPRQ
ncbi:MAG: hypothetical protein LBE12_04280 [Planctomycetaceae bacterium]|nr:hypothetical protein [Planctomycetaceae bacterium]